MQLFKPLHRIQDAGLSLQFSQLLENLVDIAYRKRLATDDDASQTMFLKERRRIRNAKERNPMAPLLKVQSQAAGRIHVPLCMDGEKSDMRHESYPAGCRALLKGTLSALREGRERCCRVGSTYNEAYRSSAPAPGLVPAPELCQPRTTSPQRASVRGSGLSSPETLYLAMSGFSPGENALSRRPEATLGRQRHQDFLPAPSPHRRRHVPGRGCRQLHPLSHAPRRQSPVDPALQRLHRAHHSAF